MSPLATGPILRVITLLLAVLWYGALAVLVLSGAMMLTYSYLTPVPWYSVRVRLDPAAVSYSITHPETGVSLSSPSFWPDAEPDWVFEAQGTLSVRAPSRVFAWLYNLRLGLTIAFLLAMLFLLRRLFGALKDGSPFTRANAARVRAIGLFIFLGHLTVRLLEYGLQHLARMTIAVRGLAIRTDFDPNYQILFLGLVLLAIAELFRHGVELEEERSLTI